MKNTFRIIQLKAQLKAAYIEYMTMDTYGAGNELFNHISGGKLDAAKAKVNEILKQLSAIDPNCPKQIN